MPFRQRRQIFTHISAILVSTLPVIGGHLCKAGCDQPVLLQVRSKGFHRQDSLQDDGLQLLYRGQPVPDDGSQVSTPGRPVTLEEAVYQLGGAEPAMIQDVGDREDAVRRELARIAVVYVSGRDNFTESLREAVLRYTPMGQIYKARGKVPENFIEAVNSGYATFPNASWYYVADDDSFVHLERLAQLTATLDASSKLFVGKRDCAGRCPECGKVTVNCQRKVMEQGDDNPGWACGGPGVLISRPLVESMVQRQCENYYRDNGMEPSPVCCGDMALSCCAYDAWEGFQITDAQGAFSVGDFTAGLQPGQGVISVHKILPETTLELGRTFNSHLAIVGAPPA